MWLGLRSTHDITRVPIFFSKFLHFYLCSVTSLIDWIIMFSCLPPESLLSLYDWFFGSCIIYGYHDDWIGFQDALNEGVWGWGVKCVRRRSQHFLSIRTTVESRMRPRATSYQSWLTIITKYDRYTALLRSYEKKTILISEGQKAPAGYFGGHRGPSVENHLNEGL